MKNSILIKDEGYLNIVSFPSRTIFLDFLDADIGFSESMIDHKVILNKLQLEKLKRWASDNKIEVFQLNINTAQVA